MTSEIQDSTKFSVIIPTYNRPRQLAKCLHGISELDYDSTLYEVIIVDDGSKPGIQNLEKICPNIQNLNLIHTNHLGPANARNEGARAARFEYLVFTDDDCKPAQNYLTILKGLIDKHPGMVITGKTVNELQGNIFSEASQLLIDYLYDKSCRNGGSFFTSNNLMIPARIFASVNGFDTSFPMAAGEDRELCIRLENKGFGILVNNELVIYHSHQLSFKSFFIQHYRYGRAAMTLRKIQFSKGYPVKFEPLSFYLNLIFYPIKRSKGVHRFLIVILLFITQSANTLGYYHELIVERFKKFGKKYSLF